MVQAIGDRAVYLYNDESQGYQRAMWLYQTVDNAAGALGMAAMANKLGQDISFLGFLGNLTPKPEKAQSIDLSVKLVDRKSTRLNSSHALTSRMPSSA